MKHAGRPRRGATRQGREKRRRRNEASVEARDEEPEPIGTCTSAPLLGGAPGAASRPPPSTATSFGSARPARGPAGDRWTAPTVRHRTGTRRRVDVVAPLGASSRKPARRPRNGLDAMGARRPPGNREEGHLRVDGHTARARTRVRTSVPARPQAPGDRRNPVIRASTAGLPYAPLHAGRSRVDGPSRTPRTVFYGNRLVGCRAGTGTRSTERPRDNGVALGRQVGTRRCPGRTDGPGIWLREVNSPGWER
jgi:hypothetical protein